MSRCESEGIPRKGIRSAILAWTFENLTCSHVVKLGVRLCLKISVVMTPRPALRTHIRCTHFIKAIRGHQSIQKRAQQGDDQRSLTDLFLLVAVFSTPRSRGDRQ